MTSKDGAWKIAIAAVACFGIFVGGMLVGRIRSESSSVEAEQPAPKDEIASRVADDVPKPPTTSEVSGDRVSAEALEASLGQLDLAAMTFDRGSDQLTPQGLAVVGEVAEILIANPFLPVEVEVKTFTEPTPGEDHGLSTLQAEAIETVLVEMGVEPGRLVSVGLGRSPALPPPGQATLLRFKTTNSELSLTLSALDLDAIELDDTSAITPDGLAVLDEVASLLGEHPNADLVLIAHAFADSETASHDLSHHLADDAVGHLRSLGIDDSRLSSVGMGDAPVDSGVDTIVEFEIGLPAAVSLALRELDENLITFEPHTDRLTPGGAAALDDVAAAMALDPGLSVEISAHTYTEDSTEANHDLSHRQGDAVVDALVAAGVDADKLQVVGHGDPPQFAQPGRDSYITFYPLD